MSTNHTTNYNLNQWEAADKVLRADFNADNAKIDAALKANADGIAANAAELAEHAAALAGKGNCQIYFATHQGNGTETASVTFPYKPLLVTVVGGSYTLIMLRDGPCNCISTNGYGEGFSAVWSGNTVTWSGSPTYQICNSEYGQYPLVAFLEMAE